MRRKFRPILSALLAVVMLLSLLPTAVFAKGETEIASDLFISEYVEGSGSNKAIEIYNGTGKAIDLSEYSLCMVNFSGSGTPTKDATVRDAQLSGTLETGQTFVYYNSKGTYDTQFSTIAQKEANDNVCNFNGNDYVYLKKGENIIDVFGGISTSMSDYPYDGGFAADCTYVRNSDITAPNATYTPNEWTSHPKDTFSDLGKHTMGEGGGEVTPPDPEEAAGYHHRPGAGC